MARNGVIRRFGKENWPELLYGVGAIGIAAAAQVDPTYDFPLALWQPNTQNLVFFPSLVAMILGGAMIVFNKHRARLASVDISKLERDKGRLEGTVQTQLGSIRDLIDAQIAALGVELGLGNDDRLTLYSHETDRFVHISRHSPNPDLREPGRGSYPSDQGVISEAWQREFCDVALQADPELDLEGYLTEQKTLCAIPKGVARNFSMKSRHYIASVVATNAATSRLGVVVVESQVLGSLDSSLIHTVLRAQHHQQRLETCLLALSDLEPDPDFARAEGF